jgi:hypothetical protein
VNTRGKQIEALVDHYLVEGEQRQSRGEAAPGRGYVVLPRKLSDAAAARMPFVEVAQHDRRQAGLEGLDPIEHRERLPRAPQPDQAQVHGDDPHRYAIHRDIDNGRAALFPE